MAAVAVAYVAFHRLSPGGNLKPSMSDRSPVFCCIKYPDRTRHTAMGRSLFEVAAIAIHWIEVDRRTFGTARELRDEDVLDIGVGMVPDKHYRVRVGRVREWLRSPAAAAASGQFLQPSLSNIVR